MVDPREEEAMDEITFKSDTVLSDVHLSTPNKRHLMVRLNAVGQPVFLSQFKLLWNKDPWKDTQVKGKKQKDIQIENTVQDDRSIQESDGKNSSDVDFLNENETHTCPSSRIEALLDNDGDLEVVRRPQVFSETKQKETSRNKIHPKILTIGTENFIEEEEQENIHQGLVKIEHTMATPLEDVGKQVWRGAFLLADYILFQRDLFKSCTVLELGAGTGIASIITATVAKTVYCTDVGEDLLTMCERNVALNKHLTSTGAGGVVMVKELDWLKDDLCTDPQVPFSWSEDEISDLYAHTTIIMAADVFYDDDLTDALFKTLYRITHSLKNASTIFLSIEKRLNFTLRQLDITCEAYNHFRFSLNDLEKLRDGKMKFIVEPIEATFPQFLVYERIEQLELWKIIAAPIS
ncbi:methyltransferase-like protein 22 isoform X1 [Monodelphis domestica]|uniref:methyltransferase-like protein 22 isoform X1 n=1 Tax=Monodelphis domestica TaxID=13616 RepID=UPI0004432F71|nr:methyltransferase-like protein 22 isoform X1 [Monodelphis domestica]XP_007498740.1 methyltransferase-like protein 22 isoform X1 [Monodelphis domestica]XP_056662107.1 methyltransferase-like protein 22 isoform X1 [Monodelphis domestica]